MMNFNLFYDHRQVKYLIDCYLCGSQVKQFLAIILFFLIAFSCFKILKLALNRKHRTISKLASSILKVNVVCFKLTLFICIQRSSLFSFGLSIIWFNQPKSYNLRSFISIKIDLVFVNFHLMCLVASTQLLQLE